MPGNPCGAALLSALLEAHVGQFGQNGEPAVDHFEPFERQHERMADILDPLHRLHFLRRQLVVVAAVDDLDGLVDSARSSRPPHFGVTAGADSFRPADSPERPLRGVECSCSCIVNPNAASCNLSLAGQCHGLCGRHRLVRLIVCGPQTRNRVAALGNRVSDSRNAEAPP